MNTMLSRSAENIYWMARYLERAAHICRSLQVAEQLTVEIRGLAPDEVVGFWSLFPEVFPGGPPARLDAGVDETRMDTMRSFLVGEDNPLAVAASVRSARENARAVREYLTREVFEMINECWLKLQDATHDDSVRSDELLGQVQQEIYGIGGAIGRTLIRDEAWVFLDVGAMLERVYRVLLLLQHRVPALMIVPEDIDIPVHHALLRAVLRSAGSLENYRRVHGATLSPEAVSRFLMFDRHTPHSVAFGIAHLARGLDEIEHGGVLSEPSRLVGKMEARLRFEEHELLAATDFEGVCRSMVVEVARMNESITRLYFTV